MIFFDTTFRTFRRFGQTVAVVAVLLSVCGCSLLHDDKVVARACGKKLYRSQVLACIPHSIPSEDSLRLARRYIDAWAGELIMAEMADRKLAKDEKDVSKELEDYRISLLKYRYEQHYVESRIDTLVTEEQIRARYAADEGLYRLTLPIVKARYLRFPAVSPLSSRMRTLLESDDDNDVVLLDSLSYTAAQKFVDYGDRWIDIVTLSREFGMDYGTLLANRKGESIDIVDTNGVEHLASIRAYLPSGVTAPLEYCRESVRESIIASRKYELSSTLEQNLLDEALSNGEYVVYEDEKE